MRRFRETKPTMRLRARLTSYRLTVEQYDRLRLNADDSCSICGRRGSLVIDHDHRTGEVRGLLCPGCNAGLGMLGDSEAGLERALAYLRRPPMAAVPALAASTKPSPIPSRALRLEVTSRLYGPPTPCAFSSHGECIRLTPCPRSHRILDGCFRRGSSVKAENL
ncbi:MAG: endonuclease VII domain-containing protein [Tepidisphaeraceae bacterium]